jgi:hypothetical protein
MSDTDFDKRFLLKLRVLKLITMFGTREFL